jgi:hypothetical protein
LRDCLLPNDYCVNLAMYRRKFTCESHLVARRLSVEGGRDTDVSLPLPVTQLRLMSDVLWIGMSSMFVKIEPLDLPLLGDAQGTSRLHRVHENQRKNEH